MAVEFRVKRIETQVRQCRPCGGTGYTNVKHNGQTFKNKCINYGCKEGRITVENDTEVSLLSALKEMGLVG